MNRAERGKEDSMESKEARESGKCCEVTLTLSIHQWYKAVQRLTAAIARCEGRLRQYGGGVSISQPFNAQVTEYVRKTIAETREDAVLHRCLVDGRREMRQKLSAECERLGINRRSAELEACRERMRLLEALEQATRCPMSMLEDVLGYIETRVQGEQRLQPAEPAKDGGEGQVRVIESKTTVTRTEQPRHVGVFRLEDLDGIRRELREVRRRSVTLHHEINGCHGRSFEMTIPQVLARETDLDG